MFGAAFSGSFTEVVSHEEADICGVAIDDIFILTVKQCLTVIVVSHHACRLLLHPLSAFGFN
jgi:hypothetical protein